MSGFGVGYQLPGRSGLDAPKYTTPAHWSHECASLSGALAAKESVMGHEPAIREVHFHSAWVIDIAARALLMHLSCSVFYSHRQIFCFSHGNGHECRHDAVP